MSYRDTTPHAAPNPEDPSLLSGKLRALIKKMLANGLNQAIRFLLSLRVGSGTGLAAMDGQDGAIIGNGPVAKFVMGDQANPNLNQWASWRFASAVVSLDSHFSAGMWSLNAQMLAAVMKNSVRVGSGTGLTSVDGQDGAIMASGGGAVIIYGDQSTPAATNAYGSIRVRGGVHTFMDASLPDNWLTYTASLRAIVMHQSLRVGAGTHVFFDGFDGVIVADGASAGLVAYDVTGSANWVRLNRNATLFFIGTAEGAQWAANVTTGLITQDVRTALTPGTSITLGVSGFPTPGSRVIKPTGDVDALIHLTASGAIAAGSVIATLASGHRPPGTVGAKGTKFTGGVLTNAADANLLINSAGQIVTETAFASTDTLVCSARFQST